jgi:hypothetical protein
MRKTDAAKMKEKRGMYDRSLYNGWTKAHEFGSSGRNHRIIGWRSNRVHQLLSDNEKRHFVLLQWNDNVIDIREQFPLLPLASTFEIANEFGYSHPPATRTKFEDKLVMTTDFLVTIKYEKEIKDIALSIKISKDLENDRTIEKLRIEKEYWNRQGIEWQLSTEKDINKMVSLNLSSIYTSYFWKDHFPYTDYEISKMEESLRRFILEQGDIFEGLREFEAVFNWNKNEGLTFLRYLITSKRLQTDLTRRLNFSNLSLFKFS